MAVTKKTAAKLKRILRSIMRDEYTERKQIDLTTARQFKLWVVTSGEAVRTGGKGVFTFVWPLNEVPAQYSDIWYWALVAKKGGSSIGPKWGY